MTKIKSACVLITGGASGIGRIMSRMALERGAKCVVVWDINPTNIEAVEKEFSPLGKIKGYRVDVSDDAAVEECYNITRSECGEIDILINCAGIVRGNATFEKQSNKDIDLTLAINTAAPMKLALQVLPSMLERDHGHICNIASAAGMIANPKMSVYAASKWAMIGWSESVRIELKQRKSKVRFTTVAPYFINTGMFDGVHSRFFPILDPESTARKILRAIERNIDFRGIPWSSHFIRLCQGLLPTSWFDKIFGDWIGIYSTMDHFTGRKN